MLDNNNNFSVAHATAFDPPLDDGIKDLVICLNSNGIETFESCQGGEGHSYYEPTVRFHGGNAEGYKAVAFAMENGFSVSELRRVWPLIDGCLTGPYWELTLFKVCAFPTERFPAVTGA